MSTSRRPFLMFAMLLAIALRTVLGAPCCAEPLAAQGHDPGAQHHGASAEHSGPLADHGEHASGAEGANPCCSACGPTLPPEPARFASQSAPPAIYAPETIRSLRTRPPFPAYDATGPPLPV